MAQGLSVALDKVTKSEVASGLKSSDEYTKLNTLAKLTQFGESAAAYTGYGPDVAAALSDPSVKVRCSALNALGCMEAAAGPFSKQVNACLSDPDSSVRTQAATTAGKIGPLAKDWCADSLAKNAQDPEHSVREQSVEALGLVKAGDKAQVVADCLNDQVSSVRCNACIALGRMGDSGAQYASNVVKMFDDALVRPHALASLVTMGKPAVQYASKILALVTDEDETVREIAVEAIGSMGDDAKSMQSDLAKLAKHKDGRFRAAGVSCLATLKEAAASNASDVAALLDDDYEDSGALVLSIAGVRPRSSPWMRKPACAAAFALGAMGSKGAEFASKISPLLKHADSERRIVGMEALSKMEASGSKFSDDVAANLSHKDHSVRIAAANTLGRFGPTGDADKHGDKLQNLLSDEAPGVRFAAVVALGELKQNSKYATEAAKLLWDRIFTVRVGATRALTKFGIHGEVYCVEIARCLEDPDPSVRKAACAALCLMGERGAAFAEEIVPLLQDEEYIVRCAAVLALGDMMEEGATFLSSMVKLLKDPLEQVRVAALQGIAKLGRYGKAAKAEVAAMTESVKDTSSKVKEEAQKALSAIAPEE